MWQLVDEERAGVLLNKYWENESLRSWRLGVNSEIVLSRDSMFVTKYNFCPISV